MKLITILLPEPYIEGLDYLVKKKLYASRAEAIRLAIRDLLHEEAWSRRKALPEYDSKIIMDALIYGTLPKLFESEEKEPYY